MPSERYRVRIKLNGCRLDLSSRPAKVRLAISTAYWPMIWPSPQIAASSTFAGTLDLPQRLPNAADAKTLAFSRTGDGATREANHHSPRWRADRTHRPSWSGMWAHSTSRKYHVEDNNPLSAVAELHNIQTFCRETNGKSGSRRSVCGCHPRPMPSCCREACVLFDGANEVCRRDWDRSIPLRFLMTDLNKACRCSA